MRRSLALGVLWLAAGLGCKSGSEPSSSQAAAGASAVASASAEPARATQPGSYFWLSSDKLERRRAFAPDYLEVKLETLGVKALSAASVGSNAAGDRLLLVSGSAIWEVDAAGAPKKLLESPLLAKTALAFRGRSPNGRWAAYVSQPERPGKPRAVFVDLEQKQVLEHGGIDDVRGFVDDTSVLAGENDGKALRLFVYEPSSQKRRPLVELPPDSRLDAVSPPRKERTAYVKRSKRDNDLFASLFYKPLGGGEERQLCVDVGKDEITGPVQNVELSPDGERVLFTGYVPGKGREISYAYPVIVAELASNTCRRLDLSPLFNETGWLSDTEVVLRHASGHVRVIHLADGRKFGPLLAGQFVRRF